MSILIQNGTVITGDESTIADIRIARGIIVAVEENIPPCDGERIIDASGMLILPGGIDPHVHMNLKAGGYYSADDFRSGSLAALLGGTTTFIDFVTPDRGESLVSALEKRMIEASYSYTDFALHVSPVEWRERLKDEISECRRRGIYSFKVYMAYKDSVGVSDSDLEKILADISDAGGIAAVHCETGDEIEILRDTLYKEGNTHPKFHPVSRPDYTESDAVKRVIDFASKANCPLYLVHISAETSVKIIEGALKSKVEVIAETCPQYLLLNDTLFKDTAESTTQYVLSPPLRKEKDNEALWQAIADEVITTIGTDHCPFLSTQKGEWKDDFRKIPNGAGGVEHRMALLFTYGVLKGRIDINRFVNITSTNAAKSFGLYPRKGTIAVGSDGDLVIWNPRTKGVISASTHHQAGDINIYEGIETTGAPKYVIKSGVVVVKNGKLSRGLCPGVYLPSAK